MNEKFNFLKTVAKSLGDGWKYYIGGNRFTARYNDSKCTEVIEVLYNSKKGIWKVDIDYTIKEETKPIITSYIHRTIYGKIFIHRIKNKVQLKFETYYEEVIMSVILIRRAWYSNVL